MDRPGSSSAQSDKGVSTPVAPQLQGQSIRCCLSEHSSTRALDITYVNTYAYAMKNINATEARKQLYRLLDEVTVSSEPVQITGKRSNAVLLSEDDWLALQETVYLLSIPGMRESIREGLATQLEDCAEELDW